MPDIASLGVRVTKDGVDETARSLDTLTRSADAAETSAKRLIGTNDGLTVAQKALAAQGLTLDQVQARLNGSTAALTTGQSAVQQSMYNTRQMALQQAEALRLTGSIYRDNRAIVLAHAEALEIDAGAMRAHGLQLGRLNMELGTFIGRITGANTAVTRLGAMVGGSVAGYGQMIGVLVGVSALLWVFEKLTSDTSEAKKQQDELTKSLEAWYDTEKRGVAGERIAQLEAERAKVAQLTSEYNNLKAAHDAAMQPGSDVTEGSLMFGIVSGGKADAIAAQITKSQAAIKAAQDNITETQRKAAYDREGIYVSDLAHLVQYNVATAAEHQKAVALLNDFQNQLTSAAKTASPELRNQLAEWVHTLQDALKPKVEKASLDESTALLQKQAEAAERVVEATLRRMDASLKASANIAQEKAQSDALLKALNDGIDAYQREADAIAIANQLKKDGIAVSDPWYAAAKRELEQTQANNEAIQKQIELRRSLASMIAEETRAIAASIPQVLRDIQDRQQQYAQDMHNIWAKGIEKIVTDGTKSFHDFFDDVLQMFQKLMQRMQKEGHDSGLGYQLLGIASEGITSAVAGSQIEQSTGSAGLGLLGATASGASLGGPAGAFVGTLSYIGESLLTQSATNKEAWRQFEDARVRWADSLAKLVTSLSGTSLEKQRQSLSDQFAALIQNALTDAENAIKGSPAAKFGASGVGVFGTRTADIPGGLSTDPANIEATIAAIQAMVGHGKNLAQNKELDALLAQLKAIDAEYIKQADALKVLQAAASAAFESDLNIRNLRAAGDVQAADAAARVAQNLKEQTDAENTFGKGSREVTDLLKTQAAEAQALAKAQAEASRQIDANLAIRQAYAKGLTAEGDALSRQEAERKEVNDALAAGWTADQIAALKLTQQLEDEKKAHDDAAAAAERYTANVASLTATFLALTGQGDASAMAGLIEQQRQATNSATASGATPAELAMLNVVQAFQRGQLEAQQEAKKQTDILNAQLKTAQDQLSTAKTQLQNDTQASDTLSKYRDSLSIGSLSALSPADQLAASRSQLQSLYARAQGGDASAASGFTSAANTFLQQSQGYNASGPGYASDFQTVQKMASTLADQYANQKTLDQQQVDLLQKQVDQLTAAIAALQDANSIAQATQAKVVAELEAQRDATLQPNGALIDQFIALRDTLTGASRDIVSAERDVLVGDQNNLAKATADEIAAINSGASLQQIAQLEMVRQLELQKTATDDGFAKQIATLGAQLGFDSPVVQQLIAQQTQYDKGVEQQVNAINGIGASVVGAIHAIAFPSSGGGSDTHGGSSGVGVTLPGSGGSTQPVSPGSGYTSYDGSGALFLRDPYTGQTYNLGVNPTFPWTDPQGNVYSGVSWSAAGSTGMIHMSGLPTFAAGGDFSGGIAMVGERGPELVMTGASRTMTASQTGDILASAQATGKEAVTELKAIVRQLGAGMTGTNQKLDTLVSVTKAQTSHLTLHSERAVA